MSNFKPVTTYILHREPMLFVRSIVDAGERFVETDSYLSRSNIFYHRESGFIPSWLGIEMLAQTAGIWAGMEDERLQVPIKLGFLLGVRTYSTNIPGFSPEECYQNRIQTNFIADASVVFSGEILDSRGALCASGELTAFRPENVEAYLGGMN